MTDTEREPGTLRADRLRALMDEYVDSSLLDKLTPGDLCGQVLVTTALLAIEARLDEIGDHLNDIVMNM